MRSAVTTVVLSLAVAAGGCGLLRMTAKPQRASEVEAHRVQFPEFISAERTLIDGRALRAAALAMDDFLPEPAPPLPDDADPLSRCLARRDSYDVLVWSAGRPEAAPMDGGAPDGGNGESDGGDAGVQPDDAGTAAGEAGEDIIEDIIFVTIYLRGGACPEGDSPVLDAGGTYAIDAANWRVLAIKH